ncbi:hypothetical protein [Marinobacter maritimus]|nr:hypothetical protein [Marinobacter maritimus]|tara:strand:- start:266 stop:412 length:147 start_codon:yes stop_codon:yes gene_type:complete
MVRKVLQLPYQKNWAMPGLTITIKDDEDCELLAESMALAPSYMTETEQ